MAHAQVASQEPIHSALAQAQQQSAVAALGIRALQTDAKLEDLLADACERLATVLGVDYSSVLELDRGGTHLLLRVGRGWPNDLLSAGPVEVSAGSQAGYTIASLEPVIVTDLSRETRFVPSSTLTEHGVVSGMCVVVFVDGIPWGVLAAHSRRARRFEGHEVDFVQAVANVLGAAIGRRRIEVELESRLKELRTSQEQLAQAQKMEAVGRLAGGVAHDFNNLLTAINGYAELIKAALNPRDPMFRQVDQIAKAGQRAAGLTHQLLAFSRKQKLEPRVFNVNAVVKSFEPMLSRIVGEDVELHFSLKSGLANVRADPGQLGQVLMNLVVNARDAMPKGGTLTIETKAVARVAIETKNVALGSDYCARRSEMAPGPYVLLAVTDTGVGMTAETLSHLFEPFFSTKGEQGTGLGLATSYGIVRQSGGFIYAYSEPGVGTTFKVYLPCCDESAELLEPLVAAPARGKRSGTILLVDDDETVREYVRTVLEASGYRVLPAANAVEALFVAEKREGPLDLLITDVVMPKLSGLELRDRLLVQWPDLKVLFVSGYPDEAIARHGLLEPVANFLSKPFSAQALLARVQRLLDAEAGVTV